MELDQQAAWLHDMRATAGSAFQPQRESLLAGGMVAGLAYYYLVPNPLLALPGLALFAMLAWRRLDLALCLLPLTFPFWFVPKRVAGQAVFPLSEVALAICVALAAIQLIWRATRRTLAVGIRGAPPQIVGTELRRRARVAAGRAGPLLLLGAGLLLVGVTLGVLVAVRPREALRAWRWEVVEPLLYAGLLLAYVRPAVARRWLVASMVATAALVAALAIVQVAWLRVTFTPLAAGSRLVALSSDVDGVLRATGIIYGSGNSLGALLERALPLALALTAWAWWSWRAPVRSSGVRPEGQGAGVHRTLLRRRGAVRLAAFASCVALCVVGIALSGSRGAEVGAAVGSLIVLFGLAGRRRAKWLALVLVVLALVVSLWHGGVLVQAALAGHGRSGEVRALLWTSAWHLIRDHPLLGIGPDQFLYYYDPAYTAHPYWIPRINGRLTAAAFEPNLAHPHNLLLDLWLSGGILGLAGFALALVAIWRRCWALWRATSRPEGADAREYTPNGASAARNRLRASGQEPTTAQGRWSVLDENAAWWRAVALGAAAALAAGVAHGMVDSAYFEPDLALLLWWAAALLALGAAAIKSRGAAHPMRPEPQETPRLGPRDPAL
ncbi:MAG TPA: O-antigen ligase family protein [Ktedonobacterales bacterium]|nr:O-antigen ligase family protein [Ktedonobacterales bacterium]